MFFFLPAQCYETFMIITEHQQTLSSDGVCSKADNKIFIAQVGLDPRPLRSPLLWGAQGLAPHCFCPQLQLKIPLLGMGGKGFKKVLLISLHS